MTMEKTFDPAAIEQRIREQWESAGAFRAGRPERAGAAPYSIVIPPPNVTGSLHMGHALNNTLQDILCRFERMRGKDVLWQPGTDHAGIATQMVVERQLVERQQPGRREMGREKFLEARLGVEGGIRRHHRRPAQAARRLLRLVARALHHGRGPVARGGESLRGALPRGAASIRPSASSIGTRSCRPRSPTSKCEQTEVKGHLWHIRYPVVTMDGRDSGEFITVATTRPETMLGDTAVAVHPEDERYTELVGRKVRLPLVGRRIPIVADEYSDPEKGTAR